MNQSSPSVRFLYQTKIGRILLFLIMKLHLDVFAVCFLKSSISRGFAARFIRENGIDLSPWKDVSFSSYRDFFCRKKETIEVDMQEGALISPCESYLLAYPIEENSTFSIKGSVYRVEDFLKDSAEAKAFLGGTALVFRLCPYHYHRYLYLDDAFHRENRFIQGELHSVQPVAQESVPVFTKNRRSVALMETEHFGLVAQIEVGALIVGGIVNHKENCKVKRGEEKGYFDLCGSTIVCLFEKGSIELLPEIKEKVFSGEEVPVSIGKAIGYRKK